MRKYASVFAVVLCLCAVAAVAQDAVKVDPKHYSVVSENDQVRILKVHYGAHEKSVMHSHPNTVAVFQNNVKMRFWLPGGKSMDMTTKAGEAMYTPAGIQLPENTSDKAVDGVWWS